MKIEQQIKIASPQSRLELYSDGAECAALFAGERRVLSIGRVKTGNFDESLGLVEKLRRHMANDQLSAAAESENVIPFGCEYRIKRQWKFAGNIGELTDDISADNGGRINDLQLEEIFFPGKVEKVSLLLAGESELREVVPQAEIYDGEKLPVSVRVDFSDGIRVEFYCGDDFWRHQCAAALSGGTARHTITADEQGVRWVRHVLILPEETETEKRPWRFKMLFAVSQGDAPLPSAASFTWNGCFATPAAHREFRNFIRRQPAGTEAVAAVDGNWCCDDGSHVSRPGRKVLHGMLGELFDEYIWSSSAAARKNGSSRFIVNIPGLSGSVIAANLGTAPEAMIFADQEEL